MVGSDIDGYIARFHELARLVPHMVTQENPHVNRYIWGLAPEMKENVTSSRPTTIKSTNRLTTDGIKDGIFKKKENDGNTKRSNDQNKNKGRDDGNTRQRTGRNFCHNPKISRQGERQYVGQHPKCAKCNFHHSGNCPVCGRYLNHFKRNCTRMNRATTLGGNRPNPVLAIEGNPNQGNNRNEVRGRAFALGVAEGLQDPNVVTRTFSLNDHFVTVLFNSGADYSFISTNFLPLIDLKPSVISPGYEIEIASGLKVETNKIIQGCRLELEGHTFIIDLIPFGHGSFDIPLSNREILEVHRERPKGNLKQLKTVKVNEQKLEDIPVVPDFPGVFPEDLSGLPLSRKLEFCVDLIPKAMPIAKSPYRFAPTKMQELSNQLKDSKTKSKEEHEVHLKLILELLEKEKLFGKFSKLDLSKITKPLTLLTQKDKKFEWGDEQENAFQTLKDMLCDASILALPKGADDFVVYYDASNQEFSYNNSYHTSVKYAPFKALYGRKCQTPITWAEVGESKLIGLEIIQETTDKIVQIKERSKATRDRQKSYADNQ
ncbi:putative reverse transcriptase domain-containing protein [Tanacetum coccineum]